MAVYSLRPATDEDSHVLFRLHRAALGPYIEEIYGPWDNEAQQRFHDRWLATAHPEVLETSDGVVGVVNFTMTGDHAELSRISIHPDRQNPRPGDRRADRTPETGRRADSALIVPRLQHLYEWSAQDLDEPRLLRLVRDRNPVYAWPFEQREVWRGADLPLPARVLGRITRAR